MALVPGTAVGPYDVVALLGAGGMGEVYRATDSNLKRSVAIVAGRMDIGQPITLFDPPSGQSIALAGYAEYDVSRDGRLLVNVPVASPTPTALVTLNWKAGSRNG